MECRGLPVQTSPKALHSSGASDNKEGDAAEEFDRADVNHDGVIDWAEILQIIARNFDLDEEVWRAKQASRSALK